jgi:hypothetical protein
VGDRTEYHRQYQEKRRLERLAMAKERLGGRCVRCGATENIDFDHIVQGTKNRKISEATNWSLERFLAEVDKCQLLCHAGSGCNGHADKTRDAGEYPQGERNGHAKLTVADIRAIRASTLPNPALAEQYSVTRQAIRSIRLRRTWKHVE